MNMKEAAPEEGRPGKGPEPSHEVSYVILTAWFEVFPKMIHSFQSSEGLRFLAG